MKQEKLKELFEYNDGNLIWKIQKAGNVRVGCVAGYTSKAGYVIITIDKKRYLVHRLVWLWFNGILPDSDIDHINRNKSDNRIENLRLASPSENGGNQDLSVRNKSGYKGVSWCKRLCKWKVKIKVRGKSIHLGYFNDILEASESYNTAAIKHFNEFAKLN
jgi:hypothetical protein